ncbi:helix-turn-helix domain-containing protein [Cohnella faecalis]|uniref:AraC family transcriptional regulator n=1 Tax=Cohnella faecalis TaxID=2315694 RepID=A0A398CP05_9BACL|nr:AraC family transcriptional regulator [Cohnella faecalis]RIE03019.1 AraC family transcriptional regulator [Cohnella faecalis]
MNPIRKQFRSDIAFPFDVAYKNTKSSLSELPDHLHDRFELVYVYSGKGTFFIDHTLYDMSEGDWFLLPGNTIHRALPNAANPVTSTAVFFSSLLIRQSSIGEPFGLLRCYEWARKSKTYKLRLSASDESMAAACLDALQEELTNRQPGYRHSALLQLELVLLRLSRALYTTADHSSEASIGPDWINTALQHIDENPDSDLGLTSLSRLTSVSAAHFSRVFKQWTGMNVTDYVNAKRMIRASELLLSTDQSVAEIASLCGFESLPHFHRLFKKLIGRTPAAYRRGNRMNATDSV